MDFSGEKFRPPNPNLILFDPINGIIYEFCMPNYRLIGFQCFIEQKWK